MLNKIILIGRTVKDSELRYTASGVATATFTLAVERPKQKDKEKEVDYINVVVWRQLAEVVANYLRKGKLAAVDGRLQVRNYENAEGKRVYVTEVVAESVKFLEYGDKKQNDPFEAEGQPVNDDDLPF